jgi:hypothetical protein
VKALACRVDSGSDARWSAPDDYDVVATADRFVREGMCTGLGLKGKEEFAERSLTDVDEFVPEVDCRYRADTEAIHFFLEEGTIDHLVLDPFVVEGHEVQCLDDLRTVGTAERSIGRQAKRRLERCDTTHEDFLGEVLALPVSVQHCQDEGSELMSAGDSTEGDARSYAISEDAETEGVGGAHLIGEVITRRSEVLGELAEFLALGTASVIDEEGILMLEASEEPLELGEDVLI